LAFEQLHHNEGLAFMLAEFVNRADVGVVYGGGSTRFSLKALHSFRIISKLFWKEL